MLLSASFQLRTLWLCISRRLDAAALVSKPNQAEFVAFGSILDNVFRLKGAIRTIHSFHSLLRAYCVAGSLDKPGTRGC
jgi:hypothetical protein